ncbi:MAG: hypothetical protein HQK91_11045 [Nitrospirae bacterium]|nr:hypothetical protein [Nitrospirota bacterium]MBF0541971.1 hypothetical protein [Nitrospirota bacterium]
MGDDTIIKKQNLDTTDALLIDEERFEEEIDDETINIAQYLLVVWKWKLFIIAVLIFSFYNSFINAYRMSNIYRAESVIQPITPSTGGASGGGLGEMGGSTMMAMGLKAIGGGSATPAGSQDLLIWAYSRTLKKIIIEKYGLMPKLFPGTAFDANNMPIVHNVTEPKPEPAMSLTQSTIKKIILSLNPDFYKYTPQGSSQSGPSIEDGIDVFDSYIRLDTDTRILRLPIITVSIECYDPDLAKALLVYFLDTLNEQLSTDAKKTAETNIKFLEKQLEKSLDPMFRTKIYSMIASQIETSMLSDVKENYALKIIDPPRIIPGIVRPDRRGMIMSSCLISFVASVIITFILNFAVVHQFHLLLFNKIKGIFKFNK